MLFTQSFSSTHDWYQARRYEAASQVLRAEKKRIENAINQSEATLGHVDDLVMYAFERLIEISESQTHTKDFSVFFEFVGRALQKADEEQ